MINNVVLTGRLTKEPQVRKTTSGKSVLSFTLAVDRRKSADQDTNQPTADFISCVAWNQIADLMARYTHKGSQIGIVGRIQTRNYDDPNNPNKKVYVTEVVCDSLSFLDSKAKETEVKAEPEQYDDPQVLDIDSDDLPF